MAEGEAARRSDLAVRTVSALVMLAVSGFALWAGGMAWLVFVLVIGIGVWFEWSALCLLMYPPGGRRTAWRYGGAVYCGIACAVLLALRDLPTAMFTVLTDRRRGDRHRYRRLPVRANHRRPEDRAFYQSLEDLGRVGGRNDRRGAHHGLDDLAGNSSIL